MSDKLGRVSIGAVVEARMTSRRLPGKHLLPLGSKRSLEILIGRLQKCHYIDKIMVAAPRGDQNEALEFLAKDLGVDFYAGSELNVMERVLECLEEHSIDVAIEVTGDCPLVEMDLLESALVYFLNSNLDYLSNGNTGLADGLGCQIFRTNALKHAFEKVQTQFDMEHVTTFFKRNTNLFRIENQLLENRYTGIKQKLSLDTREDYDYLNELVTNLEKKKDILSVNYFDIEMIIDNQKND